MLLAAALDILIAAGIILSIYYYNYLAPHKFDIPATIPSGSLTADNAAMTEGGAPETLLSLAPAQNTPAPVSYTHLDVYKRQSYVCTNLNAIILPVFNKDFCVGSSFILAMYAVISVLSSKRS